MGQRSEDLFDEDQRTQVDSLRPYLEVKKLTLKDLPTDITNKFTSKFTNKFTKTLTNNLSNKATKKFIMEVERESSM